VLSVVISIAARAYVVGPELVSVIGQSRLLALVGRRAAHLVENPWLAGVSAMQTVFDGADLTNANFTGANLTNAIFTNAKLDGAVFTSAKLDGATFDSGKEPKV
jgi:hypothetical protein